MKFDILIKNGTIVDGTGAPPLKGDVRVVDGLIAEIGPKLERKGRERVIDAAGCYVTPGFIETHNHYDAVMWWNANLEPMSGYGVTTSVNGNCGFGIAPITDDLESRAEMNRIFSFFEDIPEQPLAEGLAWDWHSWGEYRDSMRRNLRIPVNFEFYCGHQPLRLAAMGLEARERAATDAEIAVMCDALREALAAGAIGFSSNLLDWDGDGRPVPSLMAEDKEFAALLDVLEEFPGKTFQIIISVFQRFEAMKDIARVDELTKGRAFKVMWAGIPTMDYQRQRLPDLPAYHDRFKAEGRPLYTAFHHVPPTTAVNFYSPLPFGQSNNLVWSAFAKERDEATKFAMLQDEEWRAKARESWGQMYPQARWHRPETILVQESESGYGPVGISFAELLAETPGKHPSDALADWLLVNGLQSMLKYAGNKDQALMTELMRDPFAIGNISDSGAHGQMLCGIGDHINLLTEYVRDAKLLQVEEAIHNLTGKLAAFFGFDDRGVLAVGKRADLVVFDIDEIECRPTMKVYDTPEIGGGRTWRYSRAAAPMRLTLVAGEPTFDNDAFTGRYPGTIVGGV